MIPAKQGTNGPNPTAHLARGGIKAGLLATL
jgi:hypothetical protein